MTATEYERGYSFADETSEFDAGTLPDLLAVCLWAAVGISLTALAFTLGFGNEFGQLLGITG